MEGMESEVCFIVGVLSTFPAYQRPGRGFRKAVKRYSFNFQVSNAKRPETAAIYSG